LSEVAAPAEAPPAAAASGHATPWWRSFFALDLLDNRHPALHGLRVLAIVSVLQFHVTAIYTQESGILMDRHWSDSSMTIFFGMDLFFFLSGFLIGAILLRSIEVDKKQNITRTSSTSTSTAPTTRRSAATTW